VLVDGFVSFDEQQGYRGADQQARSGGRLGSQARRRSRRCPTSAPWRLAVVLEVEDGSARIGLQPGANRRRGLQGAREPACFRSKA
jgi:penicillin-binding protein 1A